MKDTVDNEEAKVPNQQNGKNEGSAVQNILWTLLLLNASATSKKVQWIGRLLTFLKTPAVNSC